MHGKDNNERYAISDFKEGVVIKHEQNEINIESKAYPYNPLLKDLKVWKKKKEHG